MPKLSFFQYLDQDRVGCNKLYKNEFPLVKWSLPYECSSEVDHVKIALLPSNLTFFIAVLSLHAGYSSLDSRAFLDLFDNHACPTDFSLLGDQLNSLLFFKEVDDSLDSFLDVDVLDTLVGLWLLKNGSELGPSFWHEINMMNPNFNYN